MDKKHLWLNLKAYHFENLVLPGLWHQIQEKFGGTNASTKAFADKISRKSGWPNKFSIMAISEYKKFVYLGVISDFAVTPSKVIDKVWHEHLLFSKAYREFCINVIQYDFDHNPELIPMTSQTGTFNAQYLDTIELYKTEFGTDPPAGIWSIPKFDKEAISADGYKSGRKKSVSVYADDTPLYMYFGLTTQWDDLDANAEFHAFGGGDGGGAGASGFWDFTDSSGTDSGSDGSDSGSGCSSGCGGCGGD